MKLQGIDMRALEDLIRQSVADMRRRYPEVGA